MSRSTAEWMELMARSVDGDLCARERVELEAALESDPALKALQARFSAVKKSFREISVESLDESFDQRLKRRVRLLRQRQWMTRGVAAAAAVAAMAVGINQLTQQGRVSHVGQGLMAAAGVGGAKPAPPERFAPGAFGQGKQAEVAQSPKAETAAKALALAPQAESGEAQNPAAPALSEGFAKTLTRAAQVMKSVPQAQGETQRAKDADNKPGGVAIAAAPAEIPTTRTEEEPPVRAEEEAASNRPDTVAAAPSPPPPSVAIRPRVVGFAPSAASSGVTVGQARGRGAATLQPVDFLQERLTTRRVAASPVRLVSYLKNAGDGLIDRVLIKVDRKLPWMRVQGLVNLLFAGETQTAAAAPMAGDGLSAAPAEFRVTPQSLVRFLSLLPGPTPLQTVSAAGESPKPVMVSEVLPQMAPVLTVAITPGTD